MKKIYIPLVLTLLVFVIGCEGKFEPTNSKPTIPSSDLISPNDDELCLEGEFLDSGKIKIPFSWSEVEGATNYRISAKATGSEDVIILETTEINASLDLDPGTMYTWQVFAIKGNEESESSTRSFYSRGALVNNYAPFPAIINVVNDGNGVVNFSWQSTDLDNDIVNYTIYFSIENPPNVYLENTTATSANNIDVTSSMTYYIIIETKDTLGNSTESKTSFTAK